MSKKKQEPAAEPQRLYLVTPALSDATAFLPALEAAMDAGDVACVLARMATPDEGLVKKVVQALGPAVQKRGAALLVEADARLVVRADADGVHIYAKGDKLEETLEDALASLKPDRIVGAGGVSTRHDSMAVGELDVDYVMFGDPAPDGWIPPLDQVLERVAWWAEIFNIPCVGFAGRLEDVAALSRAGADFVALGDAVWADQRGPAAAVRDAQAALVRGDTA